MLCSALYMLVLARGDSYICVITLCEFSASVKRLHVRGVDSTNSVTLYRVNMQFLFCVYLADIVFRVPTLGLMA